MVFHKTLITAAVLTLSLLPSMGQLIAGINFGDNKEEVEKKLKESNLADANRNNKNTAFGSTGKNEAFKTTTKLNELQYEIHYNWDKDNKLESLNFHSQNISKDEFQGKLKTSWAHLTNFLTNIHGKATSAVEYPAQDSIVMNSIYFTHEWKTETGYLYMGAGLKENGYTLVMNFTKEPLPDNE